jgi:hypothetical protein
VESGWRPYSDGHWVWTDDGWYWASDEPWAWATYHYGRWYCDDYYGWVWMPGYEWAPAWVEWRYGGDYVGWAPLSPYAVFSANWGVHYRRYWATPYNYWSFVDCRYMGSHDLRRYVYGTGDNTRFIGRTRTAGSVRYDNGRIITRGPERDYVEQRGNIRVPRGNLVDVRGREQAGMVRESGGGRIGVYRPRFDAGVRGGAGSTTIRWVSTRGGRTCGGSMSRAGCVRLWVRDPPPLFDPLNRISSGSARRSVRTTRIGTRTAPWSGLIARSGLPIAV